MWYNEKELNDLINKAGKLHKYWEAMALIKARTAYPKKQLYYVDDKILDNIA